MGVSAGGGRKHNFGRACVKLIKNYVLEILMSRAIDWNISESNRKGGGPEIFGPPSFGHSYEILNISSESSAQIQSIGTLC